MLKRHYFHSSRYDELKNKKVMVFGAGIKGVAAIRTLAGKGIKTAYFVDNDSKKHGCKIEGIEVISAEKSLEIKNAIYIIATIYFCYSIFRQLQSMGIPDEKIAVVKII
jgi:FlaA1/EpsC-like NDP-sugar epimerase